MDSQVVGYYMLELTVINAESIPNDDQEHFSGLHQYTSFGAVEIAYLAVEKEFQHRGIGTAVLAAIVTSVRRWCEIIPIRYIVLDALTEKVDWYENRGFFHIGSVDRSGSCCTVKMVMDLCDHEKIDEYVAEFI